MCCVFSFFYIIKFQTLIFWWFVLFNISLHFLLIFVDFFQICRNYDPSCDHILHVTLFQKFQNSFAYFSLFHITDEFYVHSINFFYWMAYFHIGYNSHSSWDDVLHVPFFKNLNFVQIFICSNFFQVCVCYLTGIIHIW